MTVGFSNFRTLGISDFLPFRLSNFRSNIEPREGDGKTEIVMEPRQIEVADLPSDRNSPLLRNLERHINFNAPLFYTQSATIPRNYVNTRQGKRCNMEDGEGLFSREVKEHFLPFFFIPLFVADLRTTSI